MALVFSASASQELSIGTMQAGEFTGHEREVIGKHTDDTGGGTAETYPLEIENADSDGDSDSVHAHYIGVSQLAMIVWYNVSGGPFGIEESVRSGGFFFSILGFLIMPFVWSLPEALMTAELGSAFPEAAGGVAWVEEAFGPAVGWQAGFLGWVSGATDNAIYPVMFLDYAMPLVSSHEVDHNLEWILLSCVTILLGYMNWRGLHIVGNMSIIIGIVAMSPFVIMTLIGLFKLDPRRWLETPVREGVDVDESKGPFSALLSGAILWRPLFNSLFWNLNSFDACASYSAEVRDPGYVLPRSMMGAWILMVLGYLLPLMIAIGATDSESSMWEDGYLTMAAEEIGGKALGGWLVVASAVSNIAQFEAELSTDAFQLMGMAERGFVPKIFATRSRHGTPTFAIILGVIVIVILVRLKVQQLIEMLNFSYSIAILLEYAAFIKLRITRPDGRFFGERTNIAADFLSRRFVVIQSPDLSAFHLGLLGLVFLFFFPSWQSLLSYA